MSRHEPPAPDPALPEPTLLARVPLDGAAGTRAFGAALAAPTRTSALAAGAPAARAAAGVAEEGVEDVRHEVAELVAESGAALAALREGRMAEAIVGRPLLRVGEHLIGFVHLLELGLGVLVVGVAVGVKLHGLLAKGGFQRGLVGGFLDAQDFVIVALGH